MFKSARWRSEKNKIKCDFNLQFHVTQVSQLSVDSLTLSVIPVDIGKPSVKLEKATVNDGDCRWENPVHETVKFFREPRTGKIAEKIYRFVVANGSTKNGVLGEALIDFAAYAEANKASTVSLPLKSPNSEAILHVMIQRLQGDVDQREVVEGCDEVIKPKSEDRSLKTHLSIGHIDEILAIDGPNSKTTDHNCEQQRSHRASSGSDLTFSSSDSSSGLNTPRENGLRNVDAHQEPSGHLSSRRNSSVPQKKAEQAPVSDEDHRKSHWNWSGGSENGVGAEDNVLSRENSQPSFDSEIDKLRAELGVLAGQANMSELELQTLRKHIVKESKRGVDLSREVACLKEQRDEYKMECERLKSQQKLSDSANNNRSSMRGGDLWTLVEEIKEELNHEKDMNHNLKLQLEKTQDANAELILAVQDLEEMLEQKDKEMKDEPCERGSGEEVETRPRESVGKSESDEDEEQKALEKLVKDHRDANETSILERKITDLYNEIEIHRRDRDEFEMQMEQLALDYEILKQENHDISYKLEQSQVQEQLKMQYECSPIHELTSHMESLERELSNSSTTIEELESRIKSLEEELKVASKEKEDSSAKVKELESEITSLNEELKVRAKQSSDSSVAIKELESNVTSLEEELKMALKEKTDSMETLKELESEITSLNEVLNVREKQSSDSSATIKKLEVHITSLEEELKMASKEKNDSLTTLKELESENTRLNKQLKVQEKQSSYSSATIKKLESHITSLDEALDMREKESSDFSSTIKELESDIDGLDEELKRRSFELSNALETIKALKSNIKSSDETLKLQTEEASESLVIIKGLESRIEGLEEELKDRSRESSDSFAAVNELEQHIKILEEELEERQREFETDLEALMVSKVKQEQRAIRAEESLRKMRWKNAGMAEKLQEEFRRLSIQMASTFEANEKVATKSIQEANELRAQKIQLEEMLRKAKSDLQLVRREYEAKLSALSSKQDAKTTQLEHRYLEIENGDLVSELEKLKKSVKEKEMIIERVNAERNKLKNFQDDKEAETEGLRSEFEKLKSRCEALENSLSEDEAEKRKLREQVFQLKNDMKKKDDAISNIEKKLKNSDGTKVSPKSNSKSVPTALRGQKEAINLREKIKLLEGQIKSKETSLEISAATFSEKEKDLQNKIEELHNRLEELSRNTETQKVFKEAGTLTSNGEMLREENETHEKLADLTSKLALLEEKNRLMEDDLKEMQERYSETSLKFAEVEGERQKLVMTVRYLKNNRKN